MILLLNLALAQEPQATWDQATQASAQADYLTATRAWLELIGQGVVNESVYYNLGNTLYRQNQNAGAILAWRRAAILAPRDPDIQANLAFARKKTQDDLGIPSAAPWFAPQLSLISQGEARVLGMALCGLALVGWGLRRKLPEQLPPMELPMTLLGLAGLGCWGGAVIGQEQGCVVLENEVKATSDLGGGVELFALHAGAEVQCIQESSGKTLLLLSDERRGWVRSEAIGSIKPTEAFPERFAKPPETR